MAVFKTISVFILIDCMSKSDTAHSAIFPIGGLFNGLTMDTSRLAFENIVNMSSTHAYHGRILYPSVNDTYTTALEVCESTSEKKGIVAMIDARPTEGICDTTCLLCNRLNISHLSLGWEPTETLTQDLFTFSYYPPPELISKAYATLIRNLQWDKFTILYEDDGSFIRLQEIINSWPHDKDPIMFRKLDPKGDNRETFKYIFKVARMSYHVIDCEVENVVNYMQQITQVENSTQYQSFILTNLDSHTLNLNDVVNLKANMTTMHLTSKANDVKWLDIGIHIGSGVKMETALTADALTHLEKAIRSMQMRGEEQEEDMYMGRNQQKDYGNPPALCYKNSKADYESIAWPSGNDLRESLIRTTAKGFTGNIEFDEDGKRTNFQLHYSKLNEADQFDYTGYWDSKTDIITEEQTVPDRSTTPKSGEIKVLSRIGLPYFDIIKDENGTEYKRGYAVDLINEIFKVINKNGGKFTPIINVVHDNKYGNPIEGTKKWNGLIGELMEHNADLAICDLSVTWERNAVVDFSTPFMTTGISMLFKEDEPEVPDKFSFLNPLALDVWLYLATTYIIVSFVILICARMSTDDWVNPHPCNQNPENLQNIWSFYNCLWLTMGAIMTQGCDILPRGIGSRWTAAVWWFFALIITASYTANMSTFLSNSRRSNEIKDVKDLAEQNDVSYGAVYNASTYRFFESSNESLYQKIWGVMSTARPPVFTKSNDEGKDRVLSSKGKYAFFMESTAIKYYIERDCDLKMVGGELDSKEYGIAMPKNFPHKGMVDGAILSLQESGILSDLKTKWWKAEVTDKKCQKSEDEEDSGSLQMKNTSGIFLVLGLGGILGFFVAVIDFLLHARQISVQEKVTYREALESEWRASLDPRVLHKSAAPPRSAPPSESPSPSRERSRSRAVSVLKAAQSFINFDEIY